MDRRLRLLFVLSRDFGELWNAMYFAAGQPFEIRFLLPEPLFDANHDTLGVPVARCETMDDVVTHVDADRPDVVFMFSGYLYGIDDLFPIEAVERFVATMRAIGTPVATSDPFLGLAARADVAAFAPAQRAREWLVAHLRQLARTFRDVPHVYPVPWDPGDAPGVSFYNPAIEGAAARAADRVRDIPDLATDRRRWLFVLSREDAGEQVVRHGHEEFTALLVQRLQDTVAAGRQPLLVAPAPLVDMVRAHAAPIDGLCAWPFTSYERFALVTSEAEYAFYWNAVSASLTTRVITGLPVFFFDAGHMATSLPALHAAAMSAYYCDAPMPWLDPRRPLDPEALREAAGRHLADFEPVRANARRAPTPAAMAASLANPLRGTRGLR